MSTTSARRAGRTPPTLAQLSGRPQLRDADIAPLLLEWGVQGQVAQLESERDQNWLAVVDGRPSYVLKIANRADTPGLIEFQQSMMQRLSTAGLPCPATVATSTGQRWIRAGDHLAWLIEFRHGRRLAEEPAPAVTVFTDLGEMLGRAAVALDGFDHPAAHGRHLQWDVRHADEVLDMYAGNIQPGDRRALVLGILAAFRERVAPVLDTLPHSVIHNDANNHNVLVDGERISGLLDFGDAVHSVTVNDLAVACAYSMLDRPDPSLVERLVVDGYCRHRALTADEQRVLPLLIRTRLAMSVAISAYQQTVHPDNGYLRISEAPAWRLLHRWESTT